MTSHPLRIIAYIIMFWSSWCYADQGTANHRWYSVTSSDTVVVFVHGIFSNSTDCWTNENGSYWPALVKKDGRMQSPSIYLGGFSTDFGSGLFRISDAAEELLRYLSTPDSSGTPEVMTKQHIVFVAHSTGGLVVRQMLTVHREQFKMKTIGLVLMASPSKGSEWANRLDVVRRTYGNRMVSDLRTDSDFVKGLNDQFADLISNKLIPHLTGVDAFESKFILPSTFWGLPMPWSSEQVVNPDISATYFGSAKVLMADHFSIVKPADLDDPSHVLLVDFYLHRFQIEVDAAKLDHNVSAWGVPPSASGRALFHAKLNLHDSGADASRFSEAWPEIIDHGVRKVISRVLPAASGDFVFDGVTMIPNVGAGESPRLKLAGHDLNALAVAATSVDTPQAGGSSNDYTTQTEFVAIPDPSRVDEDTSYPSFSDHFPTQFGPVAAAQSLSKEWGYYIILALAGRCLANPQHMTCDRNQLLRLLGSAQKSLEDSDPQPLKDELSRFTKLAGQ
ncbi:MAG TPA: alpha/beta hydrolase [Lacipirellulaceae bacterium]|nr:alpha/beta hydrolase [Lacipirellulaceae bacterium]